MGGRDPESENGDPEKYFGPEQGHVKAQFNLGVMNEHGQGVRQDYGEAIKWYSRAAEQGTCVSQDPRFSLSGSRPQKK